MDVNIRRCTPETYADGLRPVWQFFGGEPTEEILARWQPLLPAERLLAAWDGEVVVGGSGAFPFRLSVPGGEVATAGITVVGVSPTHRRRGIMRRLLEAQLVAAHEQGEPVAALFASEGGIYGRFGFGVAALFGELSLPRVYGALRGDPVTDARTRLVDAEEALILFPPLHETVRAQRPGMPSRSADWWRLRVLGPPVPGHEEGGMKMFVVVEFAGGPAGYAVYRHHQRFEHGSSVGHLQVIEALATSPGATDALWRYLIGVDWVDRVVAGLLPLDHELHLKAVEQRRLRFTVGDGLWIRLLDIGPALASRTFAGDVEVVLDMTEDVLCPWNVGRWLVSSGGCERTQREPEIRLAVRELGSAYLGGFSFSELARAGLLEELRPGALGRADALFAAAAKPWCPEIF